MTAGLCRLGETAGMYDLVEDHHAIEQLAIKRHSSLAQAIKG